MEELNPAIALTALIVSALSLLVSALSLLRAQRSATRAKKAEAIKELLAEKETISFAALKLLRDGFPKRKKDREIVLAAVIQACIFEASDRSRASLYRVLDENRARYGNEIRAAFNSVSQTFELMNKFGFTNEQLDLQRGRRRLGAVETVLNYGAPDLSKQ